MLVSYFSHVNFEITKSLGIIKIEFVKYLFRLTWFRNGTFQPKFDVIRNWENKLSIISNSTYTFVFNNLLVTTTVNIRYEM